MKIDQFLVVLLLISSAGSSSAAQEASLQYQLGLNDISVLIPLPQDMNEMQEFLQPASQLNPNEKNVLFPRSVYQYLPTLTTSSEQDQHYNHNLRVVAIRFDPCFVEGFSPAACQPQIRLVWQPLFFKSNMATGEMKPGTLDQAIHTFYNLTADEWTALKADLQRISSTDPQAALQIHPTLKSERFAGAYWTQLKQLILKNAGKRNLVRTTVMIMRGGFVWSFRGFDFVKGQWVRIQIPTLKAPEHPEEEIINAAFFIAPESLAHLNEFKGGNATFMDVYNPTWASLLSDSKKFRETQTEDEIKSALSMAFKLENPNLNNPATTDCVSCHISQTVKLWGKNHFPQWNFDTLFANEQFTNAKFNMTNTSVNPSNVDRVRAFGYFNDEPIISQRVINETVQILSNPY